MTLLSSPHPCGGGYYSNFAIAVFCILLPQQPPQGNKISNKGLSTFVCWILWVKWIQAFVVYLGWHLVELHLKLRYVEKLNNG